MRILHAIHDFLPRHRAGSEIYADSLAREQATKHHVTVLCSEFDPSRSHGEVTWRVHEGLPVVEVINNWACRSFEETYRSPVITSQLERVLRITQPEVLHVHNLLNLSFDLPRLAHAAGAAVVATLHDYTLVCPSGGQRVHCAESHVCRTIEADRCARCFTQSPFYTQAAVSRVATASGPMGRAAILARRTFPVAATTLARAGSRVAGMSVTEREIEARLTAAKIVFEEIDLFVAPSKSIADEFTALGMRESKIRISDYGFNQLTRLPHTRQTGTLRVGFVGTPVWHKGLHILIDAIGRLPAGACELKIFGDVDVFPDYVSSLKKQAQGLPVCFMGGFTRHQTADIYEQFDVLVVPSLWLENSPLVIHEAFMRGIPVVAARIGGMVNLVDHGQNGLLYEPYSAEALAHALRSLIEQPDMLDRFGSCLPSVKSMADNARELDGIYDDVRHLHMREGQNA